MNFVLLQLLAFISFASGDEVILSTNQGILKGQIDESRGGRPYYAFYGIPYAEPPVRELRLEDPVPPKPWQGIRDATILPPPCISVNDFDELDGEEDCLYLNLYTPRLTNETLLPVIVYVYGGHFQFGHALPNRYGPHYFMDKDVILITFHFRLGALGFLSTEDDVLPGNYGMKDVIAVLKWIQENIGSFGGNKDAVTLVGGSSGGMTTVLTLISPLAKGLFHRCVSHSGSPFRVIQPGVARRRAWKFAAHVEGCNGDSVITSEDLKACLKNLPVDVIVKKNTILKTLGHLLPIQPFGPVIEDENRPGAFLVDHPSKLLSRKSDIPLITGFNGDDGAMCTIFTYYNPVMKNADKLVTQYHPFFSKLAGFEEKGIDPIKLREISEKIKEYFFGDSDISTNPEAFTRFHTIIATLLPLKRLIELYKGPLYFYRYDHRNEESFAEMYGGDPTKDMGVIHGDELISFFNWSEVITPVTKGTDLVVSQQMLNFWVNFATFGDPNGNEEKIWKPVKTRKLEHLYIKNGLLEMRDEPFKEDLEFVDKLLASAPVSNYR